MSRQCAAVSTLASNIVSGWEAGGLTHVAPQDVIVVLEGSLAEGVVVVVVVVEGLSEEVLWVSVSTVIIFRLLRCREGN